MKNARFSTVRVLLLAVSMFSLGLGCGESGETTGSGGTAGSGGAAGTGGSAAPVITRVAWQWPEGDDCKVGMTGAVTVTVSATDDDTDEVDLDYTGSVSDCSPDPFGGAVSYVAILDCDPDSLERRTGSVTVTDPDDNSDTVTFEFQPCESGSVCEGGDPCE